MDLQRYSHRLVIPALISPRRAAHESARPPEKGKLHEISTICKKAMFNVSSFAKSLICAAIITWGAVSCTMIKDDLEKCPSGVQVKLEMTMAGVQYSERSAAEQFAADLDNMALWVFDHNGVFVERFDDTGENFKRNDNSMYLPIAPGTYKMVVWTGTTNEPNYIVPTMTPGLSTIDDLTVKVARNLVGTEYRQGEQLAPLWHGWIDNAVVKKSEYTLLEINLIKNTNTVVTTLQVMDPDFAAEDYSFALVANNGYMAYDNRLLTDNDIHYDAYLVKPPTDISADPLNPEIVTVAYTNTLRLMADRQVRFVVWNHENAGSNPILNIDITKYILLTREDYNSANGVSLSDQAYLDSQDYYRIFLFLKPTGTAGTFAFVEMSINGWVINLSNENIGL